VAARFTLDAMPGKQMSIDADLNAGLIDEEEAKARRTRIAREADFYGAMDGAAKFVRGDAIAGIIITLINILAALSSACSKRRCFLRKPPRTTPFSRWETAWSPRSRSNHLHRGGHRGEQDRL
jgi:flagellar biosynthesis component FlhA